ncbi:unannotated protein [freshwater metagenome]|uniref:Unannotated protein n=1 Tax=freshwater metagenome TaxID=449393 RepID=A0A6J7SNI9_9ZZZZ|nr:hypothetical protein [Actinomycetota bacterium]
MEQHAWSGRIDYIHDERGERGREWFTVTTHQDGHRVVRARCEMDDTEIMRDVTYSMNGFTPEEAYIRIVIKGKHEGSGWFTFDENEARCEAIIAGGGRVSQTMKTPGPAASFGAHPVLCDCLHASLYKHGGSKRQRVTNILNSSHSPDGSTGPMLGEWEFDIEFIGEERITVPAGTFDTYHYTYHLDHYGWAPEQVWVMPGSNQLVKIYWDVLKTSYVLAELNGDPR